MAAARSTLEIVRGFTLRCIGYMTVTFLLMLLTPGLVPGGHPLLKRTLERQLSEGTPVKDLASAHTLLNLDLVLVILLLIAFVDTVVTLIRLPANVEAFRNAGLRRLLATIPILFALYTAFVNFRENSALSDALAHGVRSSAVEASDFGSQKWIYAGITAILLILLFLMSLVNAVQRMKSNQQPSSS